MQKTFKKALLASGIFFSLGALASGGTSWTYEGSTGPEHWGDLDHAYEACSHGQEQSPVDLSAAVLDKKLPELEMNYKKAPLTVVNNGHTLQVNVDNGSKLRSEKGKQRLLQFHFHSPSEHTVNGQSFPLEAHFVHVNEKGELSVVGVLFEEGKANKAFADILASAPEHPGTHAVEGKTIHPEVFLPNGDELESFYRLMGSLTTPPCSEGVNWYVAKDHLSVSYDQAEAFQHLFHGGNNRPVQPINERVIKSAED